MQTRAYHFALRIYLLQKRKLLVQYFKLIRDLLSKRHVRCPASIKVCCDLVACALPSHMGCIRKHAICFIDTNLDGHEQAFELLTEELAPSTGSTKSSVHKFRRSSEGFRLLVDGLPSLEKLDGEWDYPKYKTCYFHLLTFALVVS